MPLFKHDTAIAEALGWTEALDQLVEEGVISDAAASKLSSLSGSYVGTLLMGETVRGKKLLDFAEDGAIFDEIEAHRNATKQGYPNA